MKLSEWAQKQGISYRTAWRWFKAGILPVESNQLANGTIIVSDPVQDNQVVAIYARVSSSDQKKDLERQVARLVIFANEKGLNISKTVMEIGSGLNPHRPKLIGILLDPSISIILIEHRDRLMRFGSEYVESALKANSRKLLIIEDKEFSDDLVEDMIEVLTSFCARLYGKRSAKNRVKKALEAIQSENP